MATWRIGVRLGLMAAGVALACSGGAAVPAEPWVPALRERLAADDYAVYAAVLEHEAAALPPETSLVERAMIPPYQAARTLDGLVGPGAALIRTVAEGPLPTLPRDSAVPEDVADFVLQNSRPIDFQPAFPTDRAYSLISWSGDSARVVQGTTVFAFSRVGFDERHARALVWSSVVTVVRRDGCEGYETATAVERGVLYALVKERLGWSISGVATSAGAVVACPPAPQVDP